MQGGRGPAVCRLEPEPVNPGDKEDSDETGLVELVQTGQLDRLQELLRGEPGLALTRDQAGVSLLHWAAINNRTEVRLG